MMSAIITSNLNIWLLQLQTLMKLQIFFFLELTAEQEVEENTIVLKGNTNTIILAVPCSS